MKTPANIAKRFDSIEKRFDQLEALLRQALHPATSLSVQEKAAAIKKAMDSGNKAVLKETLRQINGS